MKYQEKPAEKKSILTSSYPPEICKSEYRYSSKGSFFHDLSIKTYPINYEQGSKPIMIAFTLLSFSGLPIETDLTMNDSQSHYEYAEKCSRSKAFSNTRLIL